MLLDDILEKKLEELDDFESALLLKDGDISQIKTELVSELVTDFLDKLTPPRLKWHPRIVIEIDFELRQFGEGHRNGIVFNSFV